MNWTNKSPSNDVTGKTTLSYKRYPPSKILLSSMLENGNEAMYLINDWQQKSICFWKRSISGKPLKAVRQKETLKER